MSIKQEINRSKELIIEIARIGKKYSSKPQLQAIFPFEYYFDNDGNLKRNELDKNDGLWTRREILTRYLLVNAVLDQGPDMEGVGLFLKEVINSLYRKEIRIFHRPLDFFKELGIAIDEMLEKHKSVKAVRADIWAKEINTNPNRYNLFFAQSPRGIISTKQVLDYSIHRCGVPLCVPLLLEKDLQKNHKESSEPLVDYIESWETAEVMSQQLKRQERYGLGSAIGDKACHLFTKWYVHTFRLVKREDKTWSLFSYELPFDNNVGRVLFRTGFLFSVADLSEYVKWGVIRKGEGKGGTNLIRVTNIRNKTSNKFSKISEIKDSYQIMREYLKLKPQKVKIHHLPQLFLVGTESVVGDLDDGLIHVETKYCSNNVEPKCNQCSLRNLCLGYKSRKDLIIDYRT